MATVKLPQQLSDKASHQKVLTVSGGDLQVVLNELIYHYPSLKPYLLDNTGKINNFICIYLNGKDVRFLENEKTLINENDVINIIPAIAGG